MNRITLVAILAVLGVGTYVLMSSIYAVSEVEQAIITQFGEPVGAPVTAAGLKVKVPFIQDANWSSRRSLPRLPGRFECLVSNCSISDSSGSTTMKACARRSTIE